MEILQEQLDELIEKLKNPNEVKERLEQLISVYPFNKFELINLSLLTHIF